MVDKQDRDSLHCRKNLAESTIFIVVNSFGKGGAELSLAILAAELSKLKHNVFYIALWNEPDSYDFNWLRESGVNVCTLSNLRSNYFARLVSFFKLIKKNRPAFIFSAMLNSNILSQVFALTYSIPHAASIRNNPATYYGKIWYKKLIFSMGMIFQKNIVFISSKVKSEYLQNVYGRLLEAKKHFVLYNPIETDSRIDDDFLYAKFSSTKNKLTAFLNGDKNARIKLVIASRLVKGKGIMEFLMHSRDKFQDERLQLYIYGSGFLESNIAEYIFREFPKKNVKIMGYERDSYKIYSTADIFVFPSTSEGFGRAPFEALLMGNLVVCNEKVSIINEFLDNDAIWQDYSVYPDWEVIFGNLRQINPEECLKSTKRVRSILSPRMHAIEFKKMLNFLVK